MVDFFDSISIKIVLSLSSILFEFVCKKKALTKQPSRFKISTTTPFAISPRHTYCWFSSLKPYRTNPIMHDNDRKPHNFYLAMLKT